MNRREAMQSAAAAAGAATLPPIEGVPRPRVFEVQLEAYQWAYVVAHDETEAGAAVLDALEEHGGDRDAFGAIEAVRLREPVPFIDESGEEFYVSALNFTSCLKPGTVFAWSD